MLCVHREAARIVGWMCMANVGLPIGYGLLLGRSNEIATGAAPTDAAAWRRFTPMLTI